MRMFATAVPGLGPLLREELRSLPGADAVGRPGHDGRADVISFEHPAVPGGVEVRCAEDVFVEVAAAPRLGDAHRQVAALADGPGLERALSAFATMARPLRPRMTFRGVVRVLDEQDFRRTDLRSALRRAIAELRPRWREGDPANIELWAVQVAPDLFRLGLRLTSGPRARRTTRTAERPGALRPSVAAAMVRLAGPPPEDPLLVDPCCGTGTIPMEAAAAGWRATGSDADPEAAALARTNAPDLPVWVADCREMPLADGVLAALCSNLPFGRRYEVHGPSDAWTGELLTEAVRTLRVGGPIVLLAPREAGVEQAVAHSGGRVALERRFPIVLLGTPTTLWVLRRT